MVVPETHDEDHTLVHCFTHLLESSLLLEVVGIGEDSLNFLAHLVRDRVVLLVEAIKLGVWMLDNLSVLNEESLNLGKVTGSGSIRGDELSDDSDWLGCINLEVRSRSKEIGNTGSEWVEIATVLVTDSTESISVSTILIVLASTEAIIDARMSGETRVRKLSQIYTPRNLYVNKNNFRYIFHM